MDKLKGLLCTKRNDRMPNAWARELCSVNKGVIKGLMKIFFDVLPVLKEWEVFQWVSGQAEEEVDLYREGMLEEKGYRCQASNENGT